MASTCIISEAFADETLDDSAKIKISWSAYFADLQISVPKPSAIMALLPMFRDTAHSLLGETWNGHYCTDYWSCYPGQIPVLTVDQPLYAIAKKIEWALARIIR